MAKRLQILSAEEKTLFPQLTAATTGAPLISAEAEKEVAKTKSRVDKNKRMKAPLL